MGHSEIGVTINTYTHLGLEDAAEEQKRTQELEIVRKEMYERGQIHHEHIECVVQGHEKSIDRHVSMWEIQHPAEMGGI